MFETQLREEALPAKLVVGEELSWQRFWLEAEPLARAHFHEVDNGVDDRRTFGPRAEVMADMHQRGIMRVIGARLDGKLVGYFTWNVLPDIESWGTPMAMQGAWYVDPKAKAFGVGHKMFKTSIELLRKLGVQYVFPHHRLQGRGKDIGKYFERMGAKPVQLDYFLWIGEQTNA